jgi:hypothetical protein
MNRLLLGIAIAGIAGCQNPAWQNPYAMIGPATVPPPSAEGEAGGYYPAAAEATSTTRGTAGAAIRSEISGVARPGLSVGATQPAATATSGEPPIRIVEASPAKPKTAPTPVKAAPAPLREPPASVPQSSNPVLRDSAVVPASFSAAPTFVETTTAAQGQWRVR